MRTLGIETTGETGGIGLAEDGRVIGEAFLGPGLEHGREVVARSRSLIESLSLFPRDLGLVAVSRGPGSFTGARVGIMAAKALAWSLKVPVVGVPTFEVLAAGAGEEGETVAVVVDAQIGRVYFTVLRREGGRFVPLAEDAVAAPPEAAARLPGGALLVGSALRAYPEHFPQERFAWAPPETWDPRPGTVARLGAARFLREGHGDDLLGLEPYYLRPLTVRPLEA